MSGPALDLDAIEARANAAAVCRKVLRDGGGASPTLTTMLANHGAELVDDVAALVAAARERGAELVRLRAIADAACQFVAAYGDGVPPHGQDGQRWLAAAHAELARLLGMVSP